MRRKIISRVETALETFFVRELSVFRRIASRLLGRNNRHFLLELLILIGLLSSIGMIAASRWSTITITSRGNLRIEGVGVYDNKDCTIATGYLDWGTLEPGLTKNITLYVRNEGNHQATIFMATGNWNPANASGYMQLSWNYGGQMLNPMEVVEVVLSLSIFPTAENILDFRFDVMIGTNE